MLKLSPLSTILLKNGIKNTKASVFYNLTYDEIRKHEIQNKEGRLLKNGVFSIDTGEFTGRSPKDKYFVKQFPSEKYIDWGKVNQEMSPAVFSNLNEQIKKYYQSLDKIYIYDAYAACGDENTRKKIRFITHFAFQHHFVKNMFLSLKNSETFYGEPDFTIINASNLKNPEWEKQGLNSENFVAINIEKRLGLIGGTSYTGENKKLVFTLYNYWMPIHNKLSLHCGASVNSKGESVLLLGGSGTGKTSFSTMDGVRIIGDDEHIYYDKKVVNIENGNYAKCAKLSQKNEPVIYNAIRENALLENVWVDEKENMPDYDNLQKTENSRVSYPMDNVPGRIENGVFGNVKRIVFLTCDTYSVLPRVSLLTKEQAIKYFLLGYTSKMAGTERGVKEPIPTFSPCFGSAFMVHSPKVYASLLKREIENNQLRVYLLNTGWHGGPSSLGGKRVDMGISLKIMKSIYEGKIDQAPTKILSELDGLKVPLKIENLNEDVLIPWKSWKCQEKYNEESQKLMSLFEKEYRRFL